MGFKEIRTRVFKMHQLMEKRFGPKFFKSGRFKGQMKDPGRELPFNREELLDWIMKEVGYGAIPCQYCGAPIDALSASIDHKIPASRNGSLGFSNLSLCCSSCNGAKGGLTREEFTKLLSVLDSFQPEAKKDVVSRLKNGSMGIRLRYAKKFPRNA